MAELPLLEHSDLADDKHVGLADSITVCEAWRTTRLERAMSTPLGASTPVSLPNEAHTRRSHLSGYIGQLPAVVVGSIMTTINAVTYGNLIFALPGLPVQLAPNGVSVWLWSTGAAQLAMILSSGMPCGIGTPTLEMIPILHAIWLQVIDALHGEEDEVVMGTCLSVTFLGTFVLGAFLAFSRYFQLARYLRVVPLVVLKGALFGVGIFLFQSALKMQLPATMSFSDYSIVWPYWGVAVTLGMMLFIIDDFLRSPVVVALFLVSVGLVPQLVSSCGIETLSEQRESGWIFPVASSNEASVWYEQLFGVYVKTIPRTNWSVVIAQMPALMGLWLTHVLCALMDLKAIELLTQREVDLDREIQSIGFGNLCSAIMGGGWPTYTLCSQNVTAHRLGGRSRMVGVLVFCSVFPALAFAQSLVPQLPKALPGCVTWWLGLLFTKETILDILKQHTHSFDVLIVVIMAALVTFVGFLQALLVGVLLALVAFAMNYSTSVGVVRAVANGTFFRSNVARSQKQLEDLEAHGGRILVVHVEGYLMFGSTPKLVETILPKLSIDSSAQWVILAFRGVKGLDYSAVLDLVSLGRRAESANKHLILTELLGPLPRTLQRAGVRIPEVREDKVKSNVPLGLSQIKHYHMALKICEDELLQSVGTSPQLLKTPSLCDNAAVLSTLQEAFGEFLPAGTDRSVGSLQELLGFFQTVEYPPGSAIFKAGEVASFCIGLVHGSLHMYQPTTNVDADSLLEVVAVSSWVGFASMLNGERYSTTALVPEDAPGKCTLLVLHRDSFQRLSDTRPDLANAVVRSWLRRLSYEWRDLCRIASA